MCVCVQTFTCVCIEQEAAAVGGLTEVGTAIHKILLGNNENLILNFQVPMWVVNVKVKRKPQEGWLDMDLGLRSNFYCFMMVTHNLSHHKLIISITIYLKFLE